MSASGSQDLLQVPTPTLCWPLMAVLLWRTIRRVWCSSLRRRRCCFFFSFVGHEVEASVRILAEAVSGFVRGSLRGCGVRGVWWCWVVLGGARLIPGMWCPMGLVLLVGTRQIPRILCLLAFGILDPVWVLPRWWFDLAWVLLRLSVPFRGRDAGCDCFCRVFWVSSSCTWCRSFGSWTVEEVESFPEGKLKGKDNSPVSILWVG